MSICLFQEVVIFQDEKDICCSLRGFIFSPFLEKEVYLSLSYDFGRKLRELGAN